MTKHPMTLRITSEVRNGYAHIIAALYVLENSEGKENGELDTIRNTHDYSVLFACQLGDGAKCQYVKLFERFYAFHMACESRTIPAAITVGKLAAKLVDIPGASFAEWIATIADKLKIKTLTFGDCKGWLSDMVWTILPMTQGIARLATIEAELIASFATAKQKAIEYEQVNQSM